jgi:hypothetical protein
LSTPTVTLLDDPRPDPSAGMSERKEISMPLCHADLAQGLAHQLVLDLINRLDNLLLRPVHVNLVVEPFFGDAIDVLVNRRADHAAAVLLDRNREIRPAAGE